MPSIYLSTLRSQFWYSSSTRISSHAIGQDGAVFRVCHGLPKSPTRSRDKPLGGRSSMPSNWLQDIPSAVQALQVCARRVSEIPWDSPWFTWRHDASFKAGHGHIKKKPVKIIQYFADVYYTVFVCVWQWVWLCVCQDPLHMYRLHRSSRRGYHPRHQLGWPCILHACCGLRYLRRRTEVLTF